jgi:3-oxoacyl-(acyl-carrier-protein) synthase
MGLIVPGAGNPEEFWQILLEGPELFIKVPKERWDNRLFHSPDLSAKDKTYQTTSAFITGTSQEAEPEEYTTAWLRHSLRQALAGVKRQAADRYTLVVGYTPDGSQHLEESQVLAGMRQELLALLEQSADLSAAEKENLRSHIETTLESYYRRGLKAPANFLPHRVGRNALSGLLPDDTELMMVDTACSSSLYAVDIGIKGLLMGKHDVAVCGGSFALAPLPSVLFAKLKGLSLSGQVRPLDQNCDGVLFSDGAGVVILKKLDRARQDGDQILAVIKAFGASSDGKGKAIYAPSSSGQAIAIERAFAHPAVDPAAIDWVVAHATGTPAGDQAEFKTLRSMFTREQPVYVTSNKSLIGHTGWAAGVASLIEVVLGLQKEVIPPQHRFSAPPASFEIETSSLKIPASPVGWPRRPDRPRAASISGFGFGGTNAHLVVQEYNPAAQLAPAPSRAYQERVALVGWSAHLPELANREAVVSWLQGQGQAPARSFGDFYPLPSLEKVKLPPGMLRTLDRCQLMVLECAHDLRQQLGAFWEANRKLTGVIMGHMGPTRAASLYGSRCHLDEVAQVLQQGVAPGSAEAQKLPELLQKLAERVERLIPASNENSFPGMMPNVIPARVANYFDLNGPNLTIDSGYTSALEALEVASRYLQSGDLEMMLVGGINGNATPQLGAVIADLDNNPAANSTLAEGAFLFALVRETTAQQSGLPVLGYLDELIPAIQSAPKPDVQSKPYNYLGAEAALNLLKQLYPVSNQPPATSHQLAVIPARFFDTEKYAPGQPLEVKRQVVSLRAWEAEPVRDAVAFLPARCLLVTDQPALLSGIGALPDDLMVLSTGPLSADAPHNWFYLPEITPEAVKACLGQKAAEIKHLRVLVDLSASAAAQIWEDESLANLHELAFLALQSCYDSLLAGDSSFIGALSGALPSGVPHPLSGLFTGLFKSATLELPACLTYVVLTDAINSQAIRQTEQESTAGRLLPALVYQDGVRKTWLVEETAGELAATSPARLGRDLVVVAVAGARGITAELLKATAEHFQPRLYLLGSNRLDQYPDELMAGDEAEFARRRPEFIREQRAAHPGKSLPLINQEFGRILDARVARQNIARMEQFCGAGRVTYIRCDVLNRTEVEEVMQQIYRAEGRIDLLVNAAGLNRSASIPAKNWQDFRAVRDIKLRGYQNLKYATRQRPPARWCNFGSFIGLTGQLGETDYASANDMLSSAATYASQAQNYEEFTIGWTLWSSVGLGANPVTKAFLEKSGLFTSMSTPEGIHHFIRELNLPHPAPATVHLGQAEKQAIRHYLPDFFEISFQQSAFSSQLSAGIQPAAQSANPATETSALSTQHSALNRGRFYLGKILHQTEEEILFERVFDLQTDSYLQHHVVNGYPTLPGTFVPEIAAEAASALLPGQHVIALEDAVFHYFLRVYPQSGRGREQGKPNPKRISAKIIDRRPNRTTIQVKVLTDVIGPQGQVLIKDKLHFEIKVILSQHRPAAPSWEPWNNAGEIAIPDPYHFEAAPVKLTDLFVSTTNTRSHPQGKRATYRLGIGPDHPVFSTFLLPSILLDGLARVAVLNLEEGEYIPLAAPASIRRIDIYEAANDCELAQQYRPIELYATPREFVLEGAGPANRFVAARPDGKVILQMKDVTGVVIGYVHRTTGQVITKSQLEQIRQQNKVLVF